MSFRIRHGQPEFHPSLGLLPPGPIQVFTQTGSDTLNFRSRRHHTKAGVYPAADGPLYRWVDTKASDGRTYIRKHGSLIREVANA